MIRAAAAASASAPRQARTYHRGVPAEPDLLTEAARRAARTHGDRAAFATPDGWRLSFAGLDRAADEIAAGLRARGLGPGSTVALVLDSGVDYAALYLAAARIGAVTAGINPAASASEAAGCLQTVRPDLIAVHRHLASLVPGRAAPLVEPLAPAAGPDSVGGSLRSGETPATGGLDASPSPTAAADSPGAVGLGHGGGPGHGGRSGHGGKPNEGPGPGGRPGERPVCICFTSGSTGAPKAAWFGDRQLRAVAAVDAQGSWGGGGHGLAITPMAHVGFMAKLPWLLDGGQTAHLLGRWSAGGALEAVARHRMPAVTGVAPRIALMVRHRLIDELDFSAVRAVIAGGGPSAPDLVKAARRAFGTGYSIRYSSTESGGVGLATALDADDDEACWSVGRPRPGVEASVRDSDGAELPPGRVGELWLRSPTVMSGYWGDPAATARALDGGWLRTGDLASSDERGLYRLAGRLDEMYVRGGYNVYPLEVEGVLGGHPGVADIAVMGRPDPVMGHTGLAVVVPADGHRPPTLEELRTFGAHRLARHKLPEALTVAGELPRRPNGKLDRVRLTEQWG